jgi:molybdate transport system permease protein
MPARPARPARTAGGAAMTRWAIASAIALALFLALPLVGVVLRAAPARLAAEIARPVVREALALSLVTSVSATLLVVALGLPVAWLLATRAFPGKRALEALIDLPMVLPPTVAGLALLMAFGRSGLAGGALRVFGISLPFTTAGVVVAQVFMAAPFFIAPARAGFAGVDRSLLDAAATLRAREGFTFRHVVLPLSMRSLLAGAAMAAARALGEFGATITFAGNLPGRTQTMPLAVYLALQSDLDAAIVLSVLLLVMSLGLLFGLRAAGAASPWSRDHA